MVLQNEIVYRHITSAGKPGMLADLHCHNGMELIYIRSGSMMHVVEGRRYLLNPGDLVLVLPSRYHYLEQLSDEPYERYNIIFDPQLHNIDVSSVPTDMEVVHLEEGSVPSGLFAKMDLYYDRLEETVFSQLLRHMLEELLVNLLMIGDAPRREQDDFSPILQKALAYVNQNLFTIENVDEIARALFISPSYLFQLFRSSLHQTPMRYIRDKRLLAAQRRIRRGMSPTVACKECGFKEYASFFRSYQTFFGHAPSRDR